MKQTYAKVLFAYWFVYTQIKDTPARFGLHWDSEYLFFFISPFPFSWSVPSAWLYQTVLSSLGENCLPYLSENSVLMSKFTFRERTRY